jgi:hypothetical protein
MQKIEVGQPFEPGTTSYQEVAQYSCRSGRHFLVMPMANISQLELKAVTEGNAYPAPDFSLANFCQGTAECAGPTSPSPQADRFYPTGPPRLCPLQQPAVAAHGHSKLYRRR